MPSLPNDTTNPLLNHITHNKIPSPVDVVNLEMDSEGVILLMEDNAAVMDGGEADHHLSIIGPDGTLSTIGHHIHGNTINPSTTFPFRLNNVYHVPNIIKNLISIRKFTLDNQVSVEFDPFGFVVKDLNTGTHITRCNST